MEIVYQNRTVERQCTELRRAKRDFSEKVAIKLLSRVNFLKAAETLESVINNPILHFHALKGGLAGSYAIDIDGRRSSYRLIVRFDDYCKQLVYTDAKSIEIIKIMEVSHHYE